LDPYEQWRRVLPRAAAGNSKNQELWNVSFTLYPPKLPATCRTRKATRKIVDFSFYFLCFTSVFCLPFGSFLLCRLQIRRSVLGWEWGCFGGRHWRKEDCCWSVKKLEGGGLLLWSLSLLRRPREALLGLLKLR
jgi:hypothetical protein